MADDANHDDLFDEPSAIAAADCRGAEDIEAGRIVEHDAILHWLAGWGRHRPLVPTS
jgi:predicted transcriptional regulator